MNTKDKLHFYFLAIIAMFLCALANEGQSGPTGWTIYGIIIGLLIDRWLVTFRRATSEPKPRRGTRSHQAWN